MTKKLEESIRAIVREELDHRAKKDKEAFSIALANNRQTIYERLKDSEAQRAEQSDKLSEVVRKALQEALSKLNA